MKMRFNNSLNQRTSSSNAGYDDASETIDSGVREFQGLDQMPSEVDDSDTREGSTIVKITDASTMDDHGSEMDNLGGLGLTALPESDRAEESDNYQQKRVKPTELDKAKKKYRNSARFNKLVMNSESEPVIIKRTSRVKDPNEPMFIRLPAHPVPRSWAKRIIPLDSPSNPYIDASDENVVEVDIFRDSFLQFGRLYQCVYLDPPLLLPGEEPVEGKFTVDKLVSNIENHRFPLH